MFFQSFSLFSRWNKTVDATEAYLQLFVNENALNSVYLGSEVNLPNGPSAFPVEMVTVPVR